MEGGDGMVAVVRGIRNAGLAVTVLDGNRQYTLLPNPDAHHRANHGQNIRPQSLHKRCTGSSTGCERAVITHCDSSAQATDGHYASIYKMTYCNVTPTSPPAQLTEFPPQRAELCRGHGNFEVGGYGSGEISSPARNTETYKGGMSWPDGGSVCSPRPSRQQETFANSLRRYPIPSPDRSEVVERLINYTQARNSSKIQTRSQTSPTRPPSPRPQVSNHNEERISRSIRGQCLENEVNARARWKVDESPTRDIKPKKDCECADRRPVFNKNYDIRYLKEVSRKFKDTLRITSYPFNHPVCPHLKERYDHLPPVPKYLLEQMSTNSVNTETQAVVEMITREASTVPRMEPPKQSVAVSQTPASSTIFINSESKRLERKSKSIQPSFSSLNINEGLKPLKSVDICNSIDLADADKLKYEKRSKSQEEFTTDGLENEIVKLLEEIESCLELSPTDKILRNELLKRFNKRRNNFKTYEVDSNNLLKSSLSDHCVTRCNHCFSMQQKDIKTDSFDKQDINNIVKEWVYELPIENKDVFGKQINLENVRNSLANKITLLMFIYEGSKLKTNIIDYLNEIPIDIESKSKRSYLNKQIYVLLNRIKCNGKVSKFNKITGSKTKLEEYLRHELTKFVSRFCSKGNIKRLEIVQKDLVNILHSSVGSLDSEVLRDEMINSLMKKGHFKKRLALVCADELLKNFNRLTVDKNIRKENTFIVLQNSPANTIKQGNFDKSSDFSISGINEADVEANLDDYMNKLTQQIDEWLTNLGIHEGDKNFREVVVNDLASDIVDRHKYLELNPSSQSTEKEELEQLKYQIFKWINKLVGEENTNTIDHADDLMKRIQNITAPMFTKQGQSNNSGILDCCKAKETISEKAGSSHNRNEQSNQGAVNKDMHPKGTCPGSINVSQMPMFGAPGLGGSMRESYPRPEVRARRFSSPSGYSTGSMKPDYNDINMMPIFGPPGLGGSMTESYPRQEYSDRRHSGPGVYNSGLVRPDFNNINISQLPMYGPAGLGESMIDTPNRYFSNRRLSGPGGFTPGLMRIGQNDINISGNMAPNSCGTALTTPQTTNYGGRYNMNQMPMFHPAGLGGSMSEPFNNQDMVHHRRFSTPNSFKTGQIQGASYNMFNPQGSSSQKQSFYQDIGGSQVLSPIPGPSGVMQPQPISSCCPSQQQPLKLSMDHIEKDFDMYLKQWVQNIPISIENPDELTQFQDLIISNVYKIIAIVKCNPDVFHNYILYQDLLEEQLDALLEEIPKSTEFDSKRHVLKTELLDKIIDVEKEIMKSVQTSTYGGKLLDVIKCNMPGPNKVNDKHDYYAEFNDIKERMDIVDNFILQMYFKDDKMKNNIYRTKVTKAIRHMVEKIIRRQNVAINLEVTINTILGALHNVPKPSEEELKAESNQILLAQEVDQWLKDLPLAEPDKFVAKHQKRKLKDRIVQKIYEIESKNIDNCAVEKELKETVLKVLEHASISSKEDVNVNFMVEELVNRLKNRTKEASKKKTVSFIESVNDFEAFEKSGKLCSSYNEHLNESYYIVDGVRKELPYTPMGSHLPQVPVHRGVGQLAPPYHGIANIPSDDFHTMYETRVPCQGKINSQAVANQNANHINMLADQKMSRQYIHSQSPGRAQQIQQDQAMNRSACYPIAPEPYGDVPQMISPQGASPPIPVGGQQTPCGKPFHSSPDNIEHVEPVRGFKPHHRSSLQQVVYTPSQNEPIFELQVNPPSNSYASGSTVERHPAAYGGLHTSQSAGSSRGIQPVQTCGAHSQLLHPSGQGYGYPETASGFSTNPGAISTPAAHAEAPPLSSIPRKRTKIDKNRLENVARRLDLEESDDDDGEECRCMERLWRLRRRPFFFSCDDFDEYPGCYHMRFPYHCLF